ncbi:MAG: diacylglycerol O-acyltransferase / wax synthase [Solirubrobacteraceae bacterium]|jgi:diacylglycerol O-acyltransferase|nr:diacylglycerol O-acyltransferase / wax synthase [Solirubrobacteraceae bacterium]
MAPERLSPLDASFLAVETPAAHMHVGWAAVFSPPEDGAGLPTFAELRAHVAARLDRAPRYRQRLEPVPLGLHAPEWVDDPDFDLDHHVRHAVCADLDGLVDAVMSAPLPRERPLWQFWIADGLDDGRLALVGKAHHCMVDGVAAVELGSLLLDLGAERPPLGRSRRFARAADEVAAAATDLTDPPREALDVLVSGMAGRIADQARVARGSLRALSHPRSAVDGATRMARTLAEAALPPAAGSILNGRTSPHRHLARLTRRLADLREVRTRYSGTTVNDVLLAAVAGGLRSFLLERGEDPASLKAMVPVSVRADGEALGNRISFIFVRLPVDEPDPVVRLMLCHRQTAVAKRRGAPGDADAALHALGYAPRTVQRLFSSLVSHPRMFNLTVSNIPGPRPPVYLRGCRLEAVWPVVPLADGHGLAVGMTTVRDTACLGLYADAKAFPDADGLADHVDLAFDELRDTARSADPVLS